MYYLLKFLLNGEVETNINERGKILMILNNSTYLYMYIKIILSLVTEKNGLNGQKPTSKLNANTIIGWTRNQYID